MEIDAPHKLTGFGCNEMNVNIGESTEGLASGTQAMVSNMLVYGPCLESAIKDALHGGFFQPLMKFCCKHITYMPNHLRSDETWKLLSNN